MTVADQIRRHRAAEATVTVVDEAGAPLADQEVVVAQRRHRFRFGGTDFDLVDLANGELDGERRAVVERSAEAFLDLFDFATLPFYWGRFEPVRGRPDTARIRTAARWLVDRGVLVKGHPLCWHTRHGGLAAGPAGRGGHRRAARPDPARRRRLRRPHRHVGRDQRGRDHAGLRPRRERDHADGPAARAGRDRRGDVRGGARDEPGATLLLNDFDMSADYERLIEGCLEAGHPDRRARAPVAHAPGLVGRREDARTCSIGSRASGCRSTSPRPRSCRAPDAARDRRPQRLPGGRLADDARRRGAPGRRGRGALLDAARPTRRSRRSPGGASPTAAGSTRRPGWSASTARRSPPTTGSTGWSRASGGCRRRRCGRTSSGGSG